LEVCRSGLSSLWSPLRSGSRQSHSHSGVS
jgi:hypothetical protein